eukprot:110595-Pleurochrysis_carterae.AAC.1
MSVQETQYASERARVSVRDERASERSRVRVRPTGGNSACSTPSTSAHAASGRNDPAILRLAQPTPETRQMRNASHQTGRSAHSLAQTSNNTARLKTPLRVRLSEIPIIYDCTLHRASRGRVQAEP